VTEAPSCLLFVYGSLKRGQSNHHELGSAVFVGEVYTAPRFALRVLDGFPLLVAGAQSIRGELFVLPTSQLPALDAFEGRDYQRCELELCDRRCAITYMARDPSTGVAYPRDAWLDSEPAVKILG
jgi:gamma-glutamylcyclotransferase (GGCT)/AIG2-like uncharacterized protein YtfP